MSWSGYGIKKNMETRIITWAIREARRVSRTFIILEQENIGDWKKGKRGTYTSWTCPWETLSSTSANALRWSGECGRAPCIHGRPKTDKNILRRATTNRSKLWDVPFFSLFWVLFTIADVIFWSIKKRKDKENPRRRHTKYPDGGREKMSAIWIRGNSKRRLNRSSGNK